MTFALGCGIYNGTLGVELDSVRTLVWDSVVDRVGFLSYWRDQV